MIRLRNLSFTAADSKQRILDGIDLEIARGERLGIIGPSGSGKTTLGFHLCGVHRKALLGATEGALELDGNDCQSRDLPGFAGVVLQNPAGQLFCRTPREEIALGPEQLGLPAAEVQQRTAARLAEWGLTTVAESPTEHLSHGMKQRVSIAAMLAIQPRVLLLDEPTNFLDPAAADRLFQLLTRESQVNGTTIIVIDHDRHRLLPWAERLVQLCRGRLQTEPAPAARLDTFTPSERGGRLLATRNLGFAYHGKVVFEAVDIALHAGEIVALTGPNGAGKTTLLRLLKGVLKPAEGSLTLMMDDTRLMEAVGLVLQDPDQQLFAHTATVECGYWLRNQGVTDPERANRVHAALDAVGLSAQAERLPMSLSYGEKRRLALASVLVARPQILCLDEPTVGLDAGNLRLLQKQLAVHAAAGGAVLFATHDLEFARNTVRRCLHLEGGHLEELDHA